MTPEKERRHRQPGRRDSDSTNFTAGALVEAVAEDRLFPAWKREDVIKFLTILTLAGTIVMGIVTFVSSTFATQKEISETVTPVADTLRLFKRETGSRMDRIENRQDAAEDIHSLIVPMARLQCLQLQKWQSSTLAAAAGLPCDSLLRRIGR